MVDPNLKYCLTCQDEYMPEIVNCPICHDQLQTGQQVLEIEEARRNRLANRSGQVSSEDEVVSIRQGTLNDMKHLENLLKAENLGVLIAGDENSCGKGCCASNFFLQVRKEEAYDALKILEAEFLRTTGIEYHDTTHADSVFDPKAGEVVCPACGHAFSPTSTSCPDCGLQFG